MAAFSGKVKVSGNLPKDASSIIQKTNPLSFSIDYEPGCMIINSVHKTRKEFRQMIRGLGSKVGRKGTKIEILNEAKNGNSYLQTKEEITYLPNLDVTKLYFSNVYRFTIDNKIAKYAGLKKGQSLFYTTALDAEGRLMLVVYLDGQPKNFRGDI
jgi:hypothetical protein